MTAEETTIIAAARETAGSASLTKKHVVLTMAGIMLAMFLSSLDQTIVGTAMPRIITDLGGFAHYTWVTTSYMIMSTITVPVVGKLSDIYGRKGLFVAGIGIFVLGSLLSGLSQSMLQIILARGFQGIGAGAMMASALIITADLFPPSERGKYMGMVVAVFGLSSVIGPSVGGLITDNLSWHWVFFINVPLGAAVIALFVLYFPHVKVDNLKHKVDYRGVALMILAVAPLMLGLSWGGVEYPWISAPIIAMLAASVVFAALFVAAEIRHEEPLIPLAIFRDRIVSVSMIVSFFATAVMFSAILFIPLYFQAVLGASATTSGGLLTPMMLGSVAGSIVCGQLLSRVGHYRMLGSAGLAMAAVAMLLLSRMSVNTSHGAAVINIVILGLGLGFVMPVYNIAVQNAVPYKLVGTATSAITFFRSIGAVFGLAIFGSLMNSRFSQEFLAGVPGAVKSVVPADKLESLAHNPQALLSPDAQAQLRSALDQAGPQGAQMFQQVFETLKLALSTAVTEVFLIGFVVVAVVWVVNWLLKEIPLRKTVKGH